MIEWTPKRLELKRLLGERHEDLRLLDARSKYA